MNDVVEPRKEKFTNPLVIGGTPVDDAIMDLIAISELAEDDPKARQIMDSLVELISAELAGLRAAEEAEKIAKQDSRYSVPRCDRMELSNFPTDGYTEDKKGYAKMKATIKSTNEVITGKTLKDIKRKMDAMLKVDGPRGLTAITKTGTEIHTELYEGQDYIVDKNGRRIS